MNVKALLVLHFLVSHGEIMDSKTVVFEGEAEDIDGYVKFRSQEYNDTLGSPSSRRVVLHQIVIL